MFNFLSDTKVLDLSLFFPGNLAGQMLGDLGADVIKVERPPTGDNVRYIKPWLHGLGSLHLMVNRNKRSLCLDLKRPEGHEAFRALVRTADVLLEAFVPGTTRRLGIDYDSVKQINPSIVYCSLSAYGQDGPAAQWPAHSMDGMAGSMPIEDRGDGTPQVGHGWIPYAHDNGGTYAAIAILGALHRTRRMGEGAFLDVSVWEAELKANYRHFMNIMNGLPHWQWGRFGPRLEVYVAGDDKPLVIGPIEKWFWKRFCRCVERDDWIPRGPRTADDYIDKDEPLRLEIQDVLRTKPRAEWLRIFGDAGVPASPVLEKEEVLESAQFKARNPVAEMRLDDGSTVKHIAFPLRTPGLQFEARRPPHLGEHTIDVLKEAGLTSARIDRLLEMGIAKDLQATDAAKS